MKVTMMIVADITVVMDVESVDAIIKTIVVIAIVIVIAIPTQTMMVAGAKKTVTTTRIASVSLLMTAQMRCIV